MKRYRLLVCSLAISAACMSVAAAQDGEPRRNERQPARAEPRAANPRTEPGPRSGDSFRRPPPDGQRPLPAGPFGGPGGPDGPPGLRGRGGFRPPAEGGFPGEPAFADREMAALIREDSELERQTMLLAQRISQVTRQTAKAEELDKAKAELKEVVTKHFDVRQKRRELQIQRLEEELKRLQEAVAKRNESRDEIISKRLADLFGQRDELEF